MSAPAPALHVKVRRAEEVRRFGLAPPVTFAALRDQICAVFGLGARDALVMKYQDNENDLVTLSTDLELAEAVSLCGALLRLQIFVKAAPAAAVAPAPAPAPAAPKPAGKPAAAKPSAGKPSAAAKPALAPKDVPSPAPLATTNPAPAPAPTAAQAAVAPTALAATAAMSSPPSIASAETPGGPAATVPVTAATADPKAEKQAEMQAEKQRQKEQVLLAREAERAARVQAKQAELKRRDEEKKEALRKQMQEANEKGMTDAPEVHRQLIKAEIERLKNELRESKAEATGVPACGKALMWARFVRDVTVPDGTVLRPQETFIKVWRFRNELEKPWPAGTRLLFVGKNSDRLGAPDEVVIGQTVNPSDEIDVSVPLTAPAAPGRYTAYFRLATAEGKKFGQRVWVMITVGTASSGGSHSSDEEAADAAAAPAPPAAPSPDPALVAQFESQLAALAQLSFRNVAVNVRLLRKFNGNLEEVVALLMRRRAAKRAAAAAPSAAPASSAAPAARSAAPAIPSSALPPTGDSAVVPIPVPPAAPSQP